MRFCVMDALPAPQRLADDQELRSHGLDPVCLTCPRCAHRLNRLHVIDGVVRCPECGSDWAVVPIESPEAHRRPHRAAQDRKATLFLWFLLLPLIPLVVAGLASLLGILR